MQSVPRTATPPASVLMGRRLAVLAVLALLTAGFLLAADNDEPEPGYLGIYMQKVTRSLRKALDLETREGVLVSYVEPDSPAETAGLENGDVIIAYQGVKVASPDDLRDRVRETPPGEQVTLKIMRDGDEQTLSTTIAERPDERPFYTFFDDYGPRHWGSFSDPDDQPHRFALRLGPHLGAIVTGLNEDLAAYFDVKKDQGLLVLEVLPESTADKAGLKAGDVITKINGHKATSPEDLRDALADLESGQEFKISIVRHGKNQRLDAELETTSWDKLPHLVPPFRFWPGEPSLWLHHPYEDDLREQLDKLRDELKDLRQELKGLREDI